VARAAVTAALSGTPMATYAAEKMSELGSSLGGIVPSDVSVETTHSTP